MRRWSNASIRVRLTSWYSAVLALMLVLYATVTFVAVRHEFYEQFDDELYDDFETAESSLLTSPDGRTAWRVQRHDDRDADERAMEVWSGNGELMLKSGSGPALPPILQGTASAAYRPESVTAGGHRWRILTSATMAGGRSIVLRVARSEDRLRMQLWEIVVVLVLGLPLIVAMAGVGGYVLARRALAPIDHLSAEARRITADRLHERLSVPNQHDEIGRLAGVINETFGRLEASFDQLRRFTADASHELRTPLAVIRGTGELALSEARTPAELKDAMGSVLEEVDRLTNLVDTLLRLANGDAGTVRLSPEALDLGELARDAAASLAILAEDRGQRVTVEAPGGVLVTADRLVLREAVTNVIDNAIKYSPRDASVTIRVAREEDHAVLTVADEGPGVPVELRERIFDRFFRLDDARSRDRGGTGLGLAIAKWAVEVNGGRIAVADAPTRGSLFRITIPAIQHTTV